jgi:exodeoxyribonuclease VII large subunit
MELEPSSSTTLSAPALSVSELTFKIKNQLEQAYPGVCVQGEVSNYKRHSSGHLYFTLKDEGAQLQVALFQPQATRLGFEPKDGDKVIARGQITVYSQRGAYQLIARNLEKVGLGELLLKLEALKKELKALGWFNPENKKKIPPHPQKIGVITSPTGAVIRDIINVLSHRHPGFHLILYPTRVQGTTAASEIAQAIAYFNKHKLCDVLLIARGGGSFEDLMPFNERPLLEAVHESQIPIISAVGHETDFTLCDFVADMRAPTPSAAAERVLPSKKEGQEKISFLAQGIKRRLENLIQSYKIHLGALEKHQTLSDPLQILHTRQQFLDDTGNQFHRQMVHRLENLKLRLSHHRERFSPKAMIQLHAHQKEHLHFLQTQFIQQLTHITSGQKTRLLRLQPQLKESLMNLWKRHNERLKLSRGLLAPYRLQELHNTQKSRLESIRHVLKALSPEAALQRGYAMLKKSDGTKAKDLWNEEEIILIETKNQHLVAHIKKTQLKSGCVKGQYQLFD